MLDSVEGVVVMGVVSKSASECFCLLLSTRLAISQSTYTCIHTAHVYARFLFPASPTETLGYDLTPKAVSHILYMVFRVLCSNEYITLHFQTV